MGRHTHTVAQPNMMRERDKHYRAVDQNDQLRLSKWQFQHTAKKVCWHKLFFALLEVLLVNIYLIALQTEPELKQDDFRWSMVDQLVAKAEELEEGTVASRTRSQQPEAAVASNNAQKVVVSRWDGGAEAHHLVTVPAYVTPEEEDINQKIVGLDPAKTLSRKVMRRRDSQKCDGNVRNPMYTSASLCLVCRYTKTDEDGRPVKVYTTKYCLE